MTALTGFITGAGFGDGGACGDLPNIANALADQFGSLLDVGAAG